MTTRSKLGGSQRANEGSTFNGASKKRSRPQFDRDSASSNSVATRKPTLGASGLDPMGDWDEEMHRHLVSAIFEIGMRNSSPAVILENMIDRPSAITSERVKSKLQKFRNSKDKAKKEFMDEYDSFLGRLHAVGSAGLGNQQDSTSSAAILQMMGCRKLVGGDAAALVTYISKNEDFLNAAAAGLPSQKMDIGRVGSQFHRKDAIDYIEDFAGAGIPFPKLSEEERQSSLGLSMLHVKELFVSMRHHVMTNRGLPDDLDPL